MTSERVLQFPDVVVADEVPPAIASEGIALVFCLTEMARRLTDDEQRSGFKREAEFHRACLDHARWRVRRHPDGVWRFERIEPVEGDGDVEVAEARELVAA